LNQNRIAEGSGELWSFLLKKLDEMKSNHIIEYEDGI